MCHREVCEETIGGKRDRGSTPKIGSIGPGGGSDRCCRDVGRGPWSRGKCEGNYGRYAMLGLLFVYVILRILSSDREASMNSIRQDLGMCLRIAQGRYHPC
jgi:hypothetical protein